MGTTVSFPYNHIHRLKKPNLLFQVFITCTVTSVRTQVQEFLVCLLLSNTEKQRRGNTGGQFSLVSAVSYGSVHPPGSFEGGRPSSQ